MKANKNYLCYYEIRLSEIKSKTTIRAPDLKLDTSFTNKKKKRERTKFKKYRSHPIGRGKKTPQSKGGASIKVHVFYEHRF